MQSCGSPGIEFETNALTGLGGKVLLVLHKKNDVKKHLQENAKIIWRPIVL